MDSLTTVGRQLIQTSSPVRASDIESHLARLSEAMSRLDHKHKLRFVAVIKETLVPDSSRSLFRHHHRQSG